MFGDVHGNLPALKAVHSSIQSSRVEQVICLGDLAFKGPLPGECVSFVRRMSIPVVSGNTDDELCSVYKRGSSKDLPARLSPASIPYYHWHSDRMTCGDMEYLAALPGCHTQTENGSVLSFSHCPLPETGQDLVAVIYGHTHVPIVMQRGRMIVANPGAVGFSLDGNWRASYLTLDTGLMQAAITRVSYDMEETIQAARDARFCFDVDWYASALRSGWWEPVPWDIRARTIDHYPGKADKA